MSKLAHCSREDLEELIARHVASGAIASSEVEALVAAAEPEAIRGQASEGSSLLDQLGPDLFVQVTSWLDSGALARLDQVCRRLHYSGSAEGPSVNDALRFAAERVHPEAVLLMPPRTPPARMLDWIEQVYALARSWGGVAESTHHLKEAWADPSRLWRDCTSKLTSRISSSLVVSAIVAAVQIHSIAPPQGVLGVTQAQQQHQLAVPAMPPPRSPMGGFRACARVASRVLGRAPGPESGVAAVEEDGVVELQLAALELIRTMLEWGDTNVLGPSSQAVLIKGLAKLMQTHLRPVCASAAVTILHALALSNSSARRRIIRQCGALAPLVQIIGTSSDADVIKYATCAIAILACHETNKETLCARPVEPQTCAPAHCRPPPLPFLPRIFLAQSLV